MKITFLAWPVVRPDLFSASPRPASTVEPTTVASTAASTAAPTSAARLR